MNTHDLTPGDERLPNTPAGPQPVHGPPPPPPQHKPHYLVWGIVVCVLVGGILWAILHRPQEAAQGGQGKRGFGAMAVPVTTAVAHKGDIGVRTNALGLVTPVYTVMIKSRVDGQLMAVHYVEGQMVHTNDPLVDIDPQPYQAQVLQMEGQLIRDQALLTNAYMDLNRYTLAYYSTNAYYYTSGIPTMSRRQYDAELAAARQAEDSSNALHAIPKMTLDTQVATVRQYEGVVELDRGALSNAAVQLAYAHITAPISGRVGLRLVDPGNLVHATDSNPLAVIAQLEPITVLFSVAEDLLPEIQQGMKAPQGLSVEAWDRDLKRKLGLGTVTAMDSLVDTNSGTIRLRALFKNEDHSLYPNQFVNVDLLLRTEHNATLAPSVAVQRNNEGSYVYVVSNETAFVRYVKEGPTQGDATAVEGLEPGEVVAADNWQRLQDGAKVTVAKPEGQAKQYAGAPDPGARGQGAGRGAEAEGGRRSGKAKKVAAKQGPAADE